MWVCVLSAYCTPDLPCHLCQAPVQQTLNIKHCARVLPPREGPKSHTDMEKVERDTSTFFLCAFVMPESLTQREVNLYRALTPGIKEGESLNSFNKHDTKSLTSSYQTCQNTSGSPPSKHQILQSQFSSPGWHCWQYPAGWLQQAGKWRDTEARIKTLADD